MANDSAGAIENQGWLNVTSSLIWANSAGDNGGAILNLNEATASLVDTDVVENTADFSGGGIWNGANASLTVVGGSISANTADNDDDAMGDGGGIYNNKSRVSLQATTVLSNSAATFGGGIFSSGALTITTSLLYGNSADDGGALFVEDAASLTTILSSTLDQNIAHQSAGAINNSGILAVTASTFSGNTAEQASAGAILNNGQTTLTNVTLNGNVAGGFGGALRNLDTLTMTSVTISDNEASAGAGIYNDKDAWLVNTILAGNSGANCNGNPLTSLGHNLEDGDTCNLDPALNDLIGMDPLLGPLADNGGDTQIHALLSGSPAIDAGDNNACPAADQCGVPCSIDGVGDEMPRARSATTATDRASLGSFLFGRPVASNRARDARVAGTSTTTSPAATSCWASRWPSPPADSIAQVRASSVASADGTAEGTPASGWHFGGQGAGG
jgi:predicted outer membrane repeat protein